ncbi:hypothetical protein [Exiguobacterium profundum]|uniref:hypothetical protein n=1 Tax=Exiguobacterium profundum TaxID=307643 RepID=UPI00093BAB14|nr:hypothetical protein [Exiguobacterium profundum]
MNLEQVTKMYETYKQKIGDRKQVYETIADTFDVKQALYPESRRRRPFPRHPSCHLCRQFQRDDSFLQAN